MRLWQTVAVCLLGVTFNAFLFGPSLQVTLNAQNDFMSIYSGTHLAFTDGMYDIAANMRVQSETANGWQNTNRLFLRPPFDALLMWPLGLLPFIAASRVWQVLLVVAIALFCALWPGNRQMAALACCWSCSLFYVFANGQDVALLLLVIALVMREMRAGRDVLAGLLFSLCAIKFHLFLLLPILIVRLKLWRFLAGLASGGAILTVLSFLAGGRNWPAKYLKMLSNPLSNPWPEYMASMHGLASYLPMSRVWEIAGILLIAGLVWVAVGRTLAAGRTRTFEYGLAAVLVGGVLAAPHSYLADCAMALPALLIAWPLAAARWQKDLYLFLFTPFSTVSVLIGMAWLTGLELLALTAALAIGPVLAAKSGDFALDQRLTPTQ